MERYHFERYTSIFHQELLKISSLKPDEIQMRSFIKLFFSAQGRINRRKYFFLTLLLSSIVPLISMIDSESTPLFLGLLFLLLSYSAFCFHIKRLHDFGFSGWWTLAIPTMIFGLFLLLKKGTEGVNKYGEDPLAPKNSEELSEIKMAS